MVLLTISLLIIFIVWGVLKESTTLFDKNWKKSHLGLNHDLCYKTNYNVKGTKLEFEFVSCLVKGKRKVCTPNLNKDFFELLVTKDVELDSKQKGRYLEFFLDKTFERKLKDTDTHFFIKQELQKFELKCLKEILPFAIERTKQEIEEEKLIKKSKELKKNELRTR
jgi:hypothetical protein